MKVARNEDEIWSRPEEAESLIAEAIRRNGDVYEFERQLETSASIVPFQRLVCIRNSLVFHSSE